MEFNLKHENESFDIFLEKKDGSFAITLNDEKILFGAEEIDGELSISLAGKLYHAVVTKENGTYYLFLDGNTYEFQEAVEETIESTGSSTEKLSKQVVVAPMPGTLVKTCVNEGDIVKEGQVLIIMESMKMETEFLAELDGRVTKVHKSAGEPIDGGQKLVEVEVE
ncbi:acetyl-CoA carboxylase biotin carboxyl carrier protein subunit [Candidatus Riflebacteria bacterium]